MKQHHGGLRGTKKAGYAWVCGGKGTGKRARIALKGGRMQWKVQVCVETRRKGSGKIVKRGAKTASAGAPYYHTAVGTESGYAHSSAPPKKQSPGTEKNPRGRSPSRDNGQAANRQA
ncbi:hypothetical protein [Sphingobacterium ginsenosidimutans]|uniref:hypothetical protein n=1 Tax=Sphingobacterium ginsenosidimutans TaxID=687845 RepID=UPI0031F7B642